MNVRYARYPAPGWLLPALLLACCVPHASAEPTTICISVSDQAVGNDAGDDPVISADGRFLAFSSQATNLLPGDTNNCLDVFVRNMTTGAITRIAVASDGTQGNGGSSSPSISADGRFVAFASDASNFVAGDTNGISDVFVRDTVAGTTARVSVDSQGTQANHASGSPSISADGRFVAFVSEATNLVAGDTNASSDVFIRDTLAVTTARASVALDGTPANDPSASPSISADGRFVAFESGATNLVAGDTNGTSDVFVRDTALGTTERVSLSSQEIQGIGGSYGPSINADGRFVAFASYASDFVSGDTNGDMDIFIRDTVAGTTARVSVDSQGIQANYASASPCISADGRFVAFVSEATNLVAGDTNASSDVFVRDTVAVTTARVSVALDGTPANDPSASPSISADGRFVAFESRASNLVTEDTTGTMGVFVRDRTTGSTWGLAVAFDGSRPSGGYSSSPSVSADGRFVAFESYARNLVAGDTNAEADVFVRDTVAGTTERVSVASDGTQGNSGTYDSSISADGRFVAFQSYASNLVPGDTNGHDDVFIRDTVAATTSRVSVASDNAQATQSSYAPSISADGRFVAFQSFASNLVAGDTNGTLDVFVHDTVAGTTARVSVSSQGAQGIGHSSFPSISADGRFVAFQAYASNLVAGDTNGTLDVFVHDTVAGTTARVSVSSQGAQGIGHSSLPSISADGRFVAFVSDATNFVAGDTNGTKDAFVRDTFAGTTARVSVSSQGTQANYPSGSLSISGSVSISADGRFVAFASDASNLVPGDANGEADIFVRGPLFTLPYTLPEAGLALYVAAGLKAGASSISRLDVNGTGRIDLADAARIVRMVAGLEPNP